MIFVQDSPGRCGTSGIPFRRPADPLHGVSCIREKYNILSYSMRKNFFLLMYFINNFVSTAFTYLNVFGKWSR